MYMYMYIYKACNFNIQQQSQWSPVVFKQQKQIRKKEFDRFVTAT